MIRTLRLAATLLLVARLAQAATVRAEDPAPTPPLEVVEDTYDAGRVEAGTRVTHTYRLHNHGAQPLELAVEASCGCTTTAFDKLLPAGGSGAVSAALETTQLRGRVVKSIRVTTNDDTQPSLTLTLIVEVVPIIEVKPAEQPILRSPVGALQPMELTLSAPDGTPFEILRIEDDPTLTARLLPADAPKRAPAVGGAPTGQPRYRLTPRPNLAIGTYSPVVTLVTTRAKAERFVLHPIVVVTGPLVATPLQLRVRSAASPVTVRISTASKGMPFRVLRAESTDTDFTPEIVAVNGRRAYDVILRYKGSPERRGLVNGTLKVTTDQPTQPLLIVSFSGHL